MNKFRELGYIEYNGKLEIRNSLLNVVLYDKPQIRKRDASEEPRSSTLDGRFGVINVVSSASLALPLLRATNRLRRDVGRSQAAD